MESSDVLAPRRQSFGVPFVLPSAGQRVLVILAQLAVVVLMATLVLWPAPIGSRILPAGENFGDIMISHWPDSLNVQRTFEQEGRLPLWNPTFGAGRPVGADPLTAMWYPPSLLVHVLSMRDYFLTLMLGHLVLAGVGMLVVARRIAGLPPLPTLVAAVAFELSPRMLGHLGAGHLTMIQAVAWLPWLIYALLLAIRWPGWGSVALTVVVAMLILAGHPQMVFYAVMMALPWVGWLLLARCREAGVNALVRPLLGMAFAGIIALALAAIHLVPLLELMGHSTRQDTIRANEGTAFWPFIQAIFGVEIPSPNAHEVIFTPGLIVLALASIGAWHRRRTAWPLVLGIVVVGALAIGNTSPLYQGLTYVVPGLDRFRSLGRIWFVAMIPFGILAGWGTVTLMAQMRAVAPRVATSVGLAAFALVATTLLWQGNTMLHSDNVVTNTEPTSMELRAARMAGKHRIYGMQRNMRQIAAAVQGARLADGWDPLLIQPYVNFMQRAGGYTFSGYQLTIPPYQIYDTTYDTYQDAQPNARLLGLVDVQVVVSSTPLSDPSFEYVAGYSGTSVYFNRANRGPAYMVAATAIGSTPTIADLEVLESRVSTRERNPEHFDITTTTDTSGYLVIGSPTYPGWVATVDDQPVAVETIEGVLPAIRLDAGKHTVTFRYEPTSQRIGILLTIGGAVALGIWMLALVVLRRRTTSADA